MPDKKLNLRIVKSFCRGQHSATCNFLDGGVFTALIVRSEGRYFVRCWHRRSADDISLQDRWCSSLPVAKRFVGSVFEACR